MTMNVPTNDLDIVRSFYSKLLSEPAELSEGGLYSVLSYSRLPASATTGTRSEPSARRAITFGRSGLLPHERHRSP
jgi:hypothetical protein